MTRQFVNSTRVSGGRVQWPGVWKWSSLCDFTQSLRLTSLVHPQYNAPCIYKTTFSLQLSSPAFSLCVAFPCVLVKRLVSCWGSGCLTHEPGVWGSVASGRPRAPGWPFGGETAAGGPCTFRCTWEKATRERMALLNVWWCCTSWRTHLDRPEVTKTHTSGTDNVTVENHCHLVFSTRGCADITATDSPHSGVPVMYLLDFP